MENQPSASRKILFSIHWKKANRSVRLDDGAWYGHILPRHSEDMKGKIPLVKNVLEQCLEKNEVFQWRESKSDEWFVQYRCHHFDPYNHFLRISMRIIDEHTAIVTSAYPVRTEPTEKEIRKYEPSR